MYIAATNLSSIYIIERKCKLDEDYAYIAVKTIK